MYMACFIQEPFPDVTFTLHIRRRTLYYLYNVIFPCVLMSALTLLVFCLPPDSGEKVTMGITVLLSFSVFLLRMGEDLPETSEFIPLLSRSHITAGAALRLLVREIYNLGKMRFAPSEGAVCASSVFLETKLLE
jgi:Neurotransmitter-gated ion-channel transmembrane region